MKYITKNQVTKHLSNDVTLLEFSHNVCYNIDLAHIYIEDFLKGYTDYSVQLIGNEYLIIYENEVLKNERYFNIDELERLDNSELIELLDNLENYYYDTDDRDDLINNLLCYTNEDYYEKHHQTSRWYDLDSEFTITGYSQGDAIAVKITGDVSISKGFLSDLFYDVPVSGKLEIITNGKLLDELYLEEFLDGGYYWDKVQVINNISNAYLKKDYHALLIEYLVENLPEELEYI